MQTERTDAHDIADMVRSELHWVEDLDPATIVVSERHGHVALTGTVRSWAEREGAVRATRRVPRVRSIDAEVLRIRVRTNGLSRDADVARAAREALQWHMAVPHGRIHASVLDGMVTLDGTVARPCEREAAEAAVRPIEGVRAIVDRIRVEA